MLYTGILFGISAAFFQDLGYIFSGHFVREGNLPGELLIHSELATGAISLALLPFLLFLLGIPDGKIIFPLLGVCIGSAGGQYFFFRAEKSISSTAVSTLMGLRIVFLSCAMFLLKGERYSFLQVFAIVLAAFSAFVLNFENGKFSFKGSGSLFVSLSFYCLSDFSLGFLVHGFGPDLLTGSLYAMICVNILSGLLFLPFAGEVKLAGFRKAGSFISVWFIKQFSLYFCYALIGPVHGNIVLSIRGPMAMLINYRKFSSGGILRKTAAVLMMTAAIIFYAIN